MVVANPYKKGGVALKTPTVKPKVTENLSIEASKPAVVTQTKPPPASVPTLSRKAQLRKEIEDLKRAKRLQQHRIEEEKRKKVVEKERKKLAMAQQQQQVAQGADVTISKQPSSTTESTSVTSKTPSIHQPQPRAPTYISPPQGSSGGDPFAAMNAFIRGGGSSSTTSESKPNEATPLQPYYPTFYPYYAPTPQALFQQAFYSQFAFLPPAVPQGYMMPPQQPYYHPAMPPMAPPTHQSQINPQTRPSVAHPVHYQQQPAPLPQTKPQAPIPAPTVQTPLPIEQAFEIFVDSIYEAHMDPTRLLGTSPDLAKFFPKDKLHGYTFEMMLQKWKLEIAQLESHIRARATEYWEGQWARLLHGVPKLTDAKCHTLRAMPRPWQGCKCGSKDHRYVNHVDCPLYRLERERDAASNAPVIASPSAKERLSSSSDKDLNPVQAAVKDRYIRIIQEQNDEEAEASFVARMEEVQLKKRGKALDSPSLSVMTMSALAELQPNFESLRKELVKLEEKSNKDETESCEDDDEDMPLGELEQKIMRAATVKVDRRCMREIISFISSRWGHCYREDTSEDYSWRWFLFHNSEQRKQMKWGVQTSNPRVPGSATFEELSSAFRGLESDAQKNIMTTYLVSTGRTGLVDELLGLLASGVATKDEYGVPMLAKDWYSSVDQRILEEMTTNWGLLADAEGRYIVPGVIKKTLRRKWRLVESGWALSRDINSVVYPTVDYKAQRKRFEFENRRKTEAAAGIQRFGFESLQ